MLALDFPAFQIAILEEIDIVAYETKEQAKSEVDDACKVRFIDVIKIIDDYQLLHEDWKKAHAVSMDEIATISKASLAAVLALEKKLPVTIAVEDSVKKGVGALGWMGDKLGDFGDWGTRALVGLGMMVGLVVFLMAAYKGGVTLSDMWKFLSKAWA